MTPIEIANALNATNLRPKDIREAERLLARWEREGRPEAELAAHRWFLTNVKPLVERREAATKELKSLRKQLHKGGFQ